MNTKQTGYLMVCKILELSHKNIFKLYAFSSRFDK